METQPTTIPPENPSASEQRERPGAMETFQHYSVLALIGGAFCAWCVWDGWFTDDPKMQEYATFNRLASGVLGLWVAFCLVMMTSAGLTARRRRREEQQTPPPA